MRGLALCLVAGAMIVGGCGSDNGSGNRAPKQEAVAQAGSGSGAAGGVSAAARPTPASLCAAEGRAKQRRQCTAGLKKLDRGKAANPRTACKALSKKKTKGVPGKSPFAVCVKAAAALMAAKNSAAAGSGSADASVGSGSGTANSGSGSSGSGSDQADATGDGTGTSADAADSGSADNTGIVCFDANGNQVPVDSPDVDSCDDTSATDSSSSDATGTSTDDTSTDGG